MRGIYMYYVCRMTGYDQGAAGASICMIGDFDSAYSLEACINNINNIHCIEY